MFEQRNIESERQRILAEYDRRESGANGDLYAPWNPGEIFMTAERKRVAAKLLKSADRFPRTGDRCLEVGYGKLGWLADMISWGIPEPDLAGIELDGKRANKAKRSLPAADLRVGDASDLPWDDESFDFIILSTVLSSIHDREVRGRISREVERVLKPNGVLMIYDAAVGNPQNPNLLPIKPRALRELFDGFCCTFRTVTLAPPISRFLAQRSWVLAEVLSSLKILNTHYIGLLVKSDGGRRSELAK
jgi:ubiquinone/menaquinone biosynthesis C-methylase UbiE